MAIITIQLEVADSRLIAMLGTALSVNKLSISPERVRAMKDVGVWDNKRKRKQVAVKLMESDGKAPWGYKKDGTPKKRPGRPVGGES